jgi:hypothetical protein
VKHAAHGSRVELARLASRELRIDRRPRVQLAVARLDLGEASVHHLERAQLAPREAPRQIACTELMRFH